MMNKRVISFRIDEEHHDFLSSLPILPAYFFRLTAERFVEWLERNLEEEEIREILESRDNKKVKTEKLLEIFFSSVIQKESKNVVKKESTTETPKESITEKKKKRKLGF
ncbi:MAG: hypothetical protein DSY42_01145 [Aquifex sp.]|nr:MAG: hypothetical protein DSY42_01145 [Aquifex sp.]